MTNLPSSRYITIYHLRQEMHIRLSVVWDFYVQILRVGASRTVRPDLTRYK